MSTPETPSSLLAPWSERRWLWGVRLASLTSMLLISIGSVEERFRGMPFTTLAMWFFHLPYLLVLLLLRRGPRKSGLALAVGTGSVVLVAAVRSLGFALLERGSLPVIFSLMVALVQGQLVTSAIRTYSTLGHESGDKRTLVWGVIAVTLYCSLLSAASGLHLEFSVHLH